MLSVCIQPQPKCFTDLPAKYTEYVARDGGEERLVCVKKKSPAESSLSQVVSKMFRSKNGQPCSKYQGRYVHALFSLRTGQVRARIGVTLSLGDSAPHTCVHATSFSLTNTS